jgi:DNA repair exonuclease SbcCD ATPase subunit
MKIKHKVVKEFQYLSPEKKIFILKAGTILEEYNYKVKTETIPIDKDIIDNNPEFFEIIDWKAELLTYIKTNKLPTPAVLTKKLVPFIEEMVLSSMQQNAQTGNVVDESVLRDIERKTADLDSREKRVKEKEDEIEIRLKRVEKREVEYKEDLKSLDKKEDEIREKSKELIEKKLDLDDKIQDLNEKERNLDRSALESSKEIDEKYIKLQNKIDEDLALVTEKEKEIEQKSKELAKKEDEISKLEGDVYDKAKKYDILLEDFINVENDIKAISGIVNSLSSNVNEPPHVRIASHNELIKSLNFLVEKINRNSI